MSQSWRVCLGHFVLRPRLDGSVMVRVPIESWVSDGEGASGINDSLLSSEVLTSFACSCIITECQLLTSASCCCVCLLRQYLLTGYYKAVRVGGGGYWRTCATRDDKPRPVRTRLPITH